VVGQPINLSDAPQPKELKPTPELGEHTEEVLDGPGLRRQGDRSAQEQRRHLMAQRGRPR
jgi:crotonobetainyl-CoA:carnitine CoA-transferase CaiB-like acyl-CoA transferase